MKTEILTEFDEVRAELTKGVLPHGPQPVFFKTKDGKTHKGHFFGYLHEGWFESSCGMFDNHEVISWHPVKVEL